MEWPQKCLQRENLNDMSMNFSASDSKIHTNSPLLLCGLDIEKHHNDLWRCSSPCKWIISCPHLWSVRTSNSILGVSFVNWTNINLADHLKTSNIWPISEYFDYWWPLNWKTASRQSQQFWFWLQWTQSSLHQNSQLCLDSVIQLNDHMAINGWKTH